METLTIGQLLMTKSFTICWKQQEQSTWEIPVEKNEILMLCDDETQEVVPGLHSVKVLHPRYGTLTCILQELIPVN